MACARSPSSVPSWHVYLVHDDCGHGTHMAHLVLKVAPHAKIHMARVFVSGRSSELDVNQQLIAQAILCAAHDDKVDIISISWGFRNELPAISDAIRVAFQRNKIILGAASNLGFLSRRQRVAFPASMRQVICIHSMDGCKNPSEFSPPATPDRTFAIIGEGLEVASPRQLGPDKREIRGTSASTAIAAGLAALVLQYARQRDRRERAVEAPERLAHCDGMRKLFAGMAELRENGYHELVPQLIFEETGEDRICRISQRISGILDIL